MKFTCLQENLNFGLQTTGHLINKNINLPILNNVLVELKDNILHLSSTNLEIGIKCAVRCKSEENGSFTVDAKLFSEYVNLLPNDQVNVNLEKNDFLNISCKGQNTKIKGIDSADFPVIPSLEKINSYKVSISEMKKAISQTVFSVSTSDSRPEIGGVLMSFNKLNKGNLFLVGTDSYRLAEKRVAISGSEDEKEIIVPLKTLQEVLRILSNFKENKEVNEMEIFVGDNQILFCLDNIELVSRIVDGKYPDYRQIIPQSSKTTVIVNRAELVKTIKTVALFSKVGICDISLDFNQEKGLVLKANNIQVGESVGEVDVIFEGQNNQMVLNYRYLLEVLNNIDAEEVKVSLIDNNVPCSIMAKDKTDYLYIIMPIKQ